MTAEEPSNAPIVEGDLIAAITRGEVQLGFATKVTMITESHVFVDWNDAMGRERSSFWDERDPQIARLGEEPDGFYQGALRPRNWERQLAFLSNGVLPNPESALDRQLRQLPDAAERTGLTL